jgi:hypothetical protein
MFILLDILKTYIKYVLLHRWNKIDKITFDILDEHWALKPTKGVRLWMYNKVKSKNGL